MNVNYTELECYAPTFIDRLHRRAGWLLLLGALAGTAWLDPWSFGGRSSANINAWITAQQAQIMVAVLGILQLGTAQMISVGGGETPRLLATTGSLLAGLGYALSLRWPHGSSLTAVGATLNFAALASLLKTSTPRQWRRGRKIILITLCLGMLLIAAMALYQLQPQRLPFADLGPDDGFILRSLRLARVAAIVLPVLLLLYLELIENLDPREPGVARGRAAMLFGTATMATGLVGASLVAVELKVLLVFPSLAIFTGVLTAFTIARRHKPVLETWGWFLISLSVSAGLLMGLYAFAGPWLTFQFPGGYSDHARRLIRLAHVRSIVLGLIAIFLSREIDLAKDRGFPIGGLLLIAASTATVGIPLLLLITELSVSVLSIGPALVTAAMILCIAAIPARQNDPSQEEQS